jgi:hypothetical protein
MACCDPRQTAHLLSRPSLACFLPFALVSRQPRKNTFIAEIRKLWEGF